MDEPRTPIMPETVFPSRLQPSPVRPTASVQVPLVLPLFSEEELREAVETVTDAWTYFSLHDRAFAVVEGEDLPAPLTARLLTALNFLNSLGENVRASVRELG